MEQRDKLRNEESNVEHNDTFPFMGTQELQTCINEMKNSRSAGLEI